MNKGLWFFSLALLILGFAALILGVLSSRRRVRGRRRGEHTSAKVVELVLVENPEGAVDGRRNLYYPVFEFYASGRLCKYRGREGAWPSPYRIGQTVHIVYDPGRPELFRVAAGSSMAYLPEILWGVGGLMILISVIIFLRFAVRG